MVWDMKDLRVSNVATLLGVSADTVRRLVEDGTIKGTRQDGRILIDGKSLVDYIRQIAAQDERSTHDTEVNSIRNQLTGIVTDITSDKVMTRVEMICGPFRIVSLISTEAAQEMKLEVGSLAVAGVKSTNVSVSLP